jgi:phage gp46-like protein
MSRYDGDVRITLDDSGEGAITFRAGQPDMDAGLETAALISMFTESGWWGNEAGEEIGATLDEICRAPLTDDTRNAAEEAVRKCLAWMVSEGVAESVEVSASIVGINLLLLAITITEPETTTAITRKYLLNWSAERVHLEAV